MTHQASWYHADLKGVSRSDGKTATGLAAYVTGQDILDERTGLWKDRRHVGDVKAWGSIAPDTTPGWMTDKRCLSDLWNAIEASETRSNSHVANHWDIALWRHGTLEEHAQLMQDIAQQITDRYGVVCTWAVHEPPSHSDGRNWHGHIAHSMRRADADGFGEKAREIVDGKTRSLETEWVRQMIDEATNNYLRSRNSDERVTHLSFRRQGLPAHFKPMVHLGNSANMLEKKGIPTKLGDINRARMAARDAGNSDGDQEQEAPMADAYDDLNKEHRRQAAMDPDERKKEAEDRALNEDQKRQYDAMLLTEQRAAEYRKKYEAEVEEGKKNKERLAQQEFQQAASGDISSAANRWIMAAAGSNGSFHDAVDRNAALFLKRQDELMAMEAEKAKVGKADEARGPSLWDRFKDFMENPVVEGVIFFGLVFTLNYFFHWF